MSLLQQIAQEKEQNRKRDLDLLASGKMDCKALCQKNFFLRGLSGSDIAAARSSRRVFNLFP